MKKLIYLLFVLMLAGCCEGPNCIKSAQGKPYKVITIEGCEFYNWDSRLAKVDCNCKPDKSKRNRDTSIYEGGPKNR